MTRTRLQRRDLEILRTIGRLRYVTTQDIVATYFATPNLGRRRLRRLSGLGMIATHRRGVPDRLPYYAWRLTSRGLDAMIEAFPDEPCEDGLAERLAVGSLQNLDHRDALARLYLALVASGAGPMPDDADIASMRAVVDGLSARATQFWWQPDGEVVVRFEKLGDRLQLVPDATVCSRHRPIRIFVELDRSTRSLSRIAENLERYRWFFGHDYDRAFPDGRAPTVLYVVRSAGRRDGIGQHAARVLGAAVSFAVHEEAGAVKWLEEAIVDPAHELAARQLPAGAPVEPRDGLEAAAKAVYGWARGYVEQLRAEGRALPREGLDALVQMHRELRARRRVPQVG
jgi:hypothetical protein